MADSKENYQRDLGGERFNWITRNCMSGEIENSELVLCFFTLSTSWAKNSTTWGGEKSLMSSGENEPSSDSVACENKIMNRKMNKSTCKICYFTTESCISFRLSIV